MSKLKYCLGLLVIMLSANGCVVVAAAGVGYMIHDEATENDGVFDPLEKVRGKDDGKN